MALADTAKLIAELSLDARKFNAGAKSALGTMGQLEKGTGRIGKGAGQLSAGLARSGAIIGGAVVTGLGAAAKAAIDFDDAYQGVVKTVDETDLKSAGLSFDSLRTSILKMSSELPISAIELSNIAANAGALGVKGKDIEAFTKTVALLGVTTNVTVDDAATALGQLQNVLGLTGDDFDNFGAALVDLGNKGASTESEILEITRRAGGAAKLAGLAADATLGWASAVANLGIQPELAGTALQNFYIKSVGLVSKGGESLKDFAKIAGTTSKKFKAEFDKNASGALEDFIQGLGKLPKDQRIQAVQSLFGKGSGLTRTILGLADSFDKNLAPAIDESSKAWKENTALTAEADKRFSTVRSQIDLLKNNLVLAGITLGEGFAPAIGRAATKLSAFLKVDSNQSRLKKLGEDIGKAIDNIDWQKVLDGAEQFIGYLKIAFDYAKRIFDAVNALPTEIKAAGIAFIGLNKLSGGLIGAGVGNIFGGLAESIGRSVAASIPVIGKAFVQPVFVTNMPVGGLGGGVPGAAGGVAKTGLSTLSKLFLVGEAIGLIAAVVEVKNAISDDSTRRSEEINSQTSRFIESQPDKQALTRGLDGVEQGIRDLQSNPLLVLVQGEALDNLKEMKLKLAASLAENRDKFGDLPKTKPAKGSVGKGEGPAGRREFNRSQTTLSKKLTDVRDKVESAKLAQIKALGEAKAGIRDKIESAKVAGVAASDRVKAAADTVRDRVEAAKIAQVSATSAGAASIVGALHSLPTPIVNVTTNVDVSATTVQKKSVVIKRYGMIGGSKNTVPGKKPEAVGIHYFYRDPDGDITEITERCRLYVTDLTTNAEEGSVATSTIIVDDPDGDLFIGGHRKFYTTDDRILDTDDQVTWVGYTGARTLIRGPYRTGAARQWRVELLDLNTILSRRLMTSGAKDRPAETDVARVQAGEASSEGSLIDDTTYLSTDNPVDMDAYDYLGQGLDALIKSAADQSGKNFYILNMPTGDPDDATLFGIWYDFAASTEYSSSLRISNVLADIDQETTWWAGIADELELDPSRVYSGAFGQYDGSWVYRTREQTSTDFALSGRDTSVPMDDVNTAAKARARADRMLRDMATEDIEGTITIDKFPARLINEIKAGQRIQVKMSHWTTDEQDFSAFTWCRILSKQWVEISEEDESAYRVTLRLSPPVQAQPTEDARAVLTWPHAPSGVNTNPLHFFNDGDSPHTGDASEPLAGDLAYAGGSGDRTGIEATSDMTVDIDARCDAAYVVGSGTSTVTISITVNGSVVESNAYAQSFGGLAYWAPSVSVSATAVDLTSGDIVALEWSISPDPAGGYGVPAGAGGGNNHLRVTSGAY